ncbi:MAG: phosphoglucosamine mutase [Butyricicoccus sp.]
MKFGTDGIRGRVPEELTVSLALRLGMAVGEQAVERYGSGARIAVGHDPRLSSDMLEAAVTAGICAAGADVERLGVIPTPAVALLTRLHGAAAGVMISASHNRFEYNGIKCFTSDGYKLTQEQEQEIERRLERDSTVFAAQCGQVQTLLRPPVTEYTDYLASCVSGEFGGLRVLFDCANGAASTTVPRLIRCLDLEADVISSTPDGRNINQDCGSTSTQRLGCAVQRGGYDIGIALDGDADRCIAVDENGEELDGDCLLGLLALQGKKQGWLRPEAVTTTVLSNPGLAEFLDRNGVEVFVSDVGDSNVMQIMQEKGCRLGGEPSGHLICGDCSTTGDGQLTAIRLLQILSETGASASELRALWNKWPQEMRNIPVRGEQKQAMLQSAEIRDSIAEAERDLDGGRILMRASGTEDVIRILVEGRDRDGVQRAAEKLAQVCASRRQFDK